VVSGNAWYLFSSLAMQDCSLWGCKAQHSGTSSTLLSLNNNLFVRVANYYQAWPQLTAYNNLCWGGTNQFNRYPSSATWTFRDNSFDNTGLTNINSAVVNDHNAYIGTGQYQIGGSGGNDQVLAAFTYTNGTLGAFYHLSTNLIHAGSRSAPTAGLYHYTVTANNAKETTNTVSIGYHYVATDANSAPLDYDGDGWPDYFEDQNGNGSVDSGETDWQISENGTTSVPGLQVYTPLRP
jgi:hypothetical protein